MMETDVCYQLISAYTSPSPPGGGFKKPLVVNRDGENHNIMALFWFSWINSTVLVQTAEENPKPGTSSI